MKGDKCKGQILSRQLWNAVTKNKNWIKPTCLRLYRCISEVLLHRKQNNSYLQYLQLRRAITIVVFLQSKAAFPPGAQLLYSLGTNVNTPLLQAPKQEFGHGVGTRVQKSSTGVPVCTPFWLVPGQSIALLSPLSSCFKMASDMAEVQKLCTQLHIGYSNCEHNTIFCRCPGTGCRKPSGDSP